VSSLAKSNIGAALLIGSLPDFALWWVSEGQPATLVLLIMNVSRRPCVVGRRAVLQYIVRAVNAKGAALKATRQPIDTSTAAGKCFLDMLGVFAEFETNLRKERQLEGIAKAKQAGVYKGRPASIDAAQVRELKAQGVGPSEIATRLGIGRASVYRALDETAA
jgi:DNA invertase Pin-like site-specific DNA recombinase